MKKVLTLALMLLSFTSFADDLNLLSTSGPLETKKIVKVKLWFEGVEIIKENPTIQTRKKGIEISEELEVALQKYDS